MMSWKSKLLVLACIAGWAVCGYLITSVLSKWVLQY